jgi:flagellar hook-basal body complex protein FliE
MPLDPLTLSSATGSVLNRAKPGGPAAAGTGAGATASFGDALGRLIDGVETSSADANVALGGMMDKTTDVHEAMIALQREELSLQLTLAVRNKLVSAYQEIMRMPI